MQASSYIEKVLERAALYENASKGDRILNPSEYFLLGRNVSISNQVIKHIVEQRGKYAAMILAEIPRVLAHPTKICDNSLKRPSSFLYVRMNGKVTAVVVEITKTPDGVHQIVSAFPMHKNTYRKLVDISGGSHAPSLDIA